MTKDEYEAQYRIRRRRNRHNPEEFLRIRTIFLKRKATYTLAEAGELLSMTPEGFQQLREAGSGADVSWEEIADRALEHYSVRYIEQALADEVAVLPAVLRTIELPLRLPWVYVLYFTEIARYRGWRMDDLLSFWMRGDAVPAQCRGIESIHPGFAAALAFPYATEEPEEVAN